MQLHKGKTRQANPTLEKGRSQRGTRGGLDPALLGPKNPEHEQFSITKYKFYPDFRQKSPVVCTLSLRERKFTFYQLWPLSGESNGSPKLNCNSGQF